MEKLPPLGRAIQDIIGPTFGVYAPLLIQQADQIKSTACSTHSYGSNPRHKLDIYSPDPAAASVTGRSKSVLVFLYGGGFVAGDKSLADFPLVYANLGHFFAEKLGFEVIVVDYRLISHGAVWPSGGEDLSLALDWIVQRASEQDSEPLDVYLMGNSAGGVHLLTYLLAPDFAASRSRLLDSEGARLKAAIALGAPTHFESGPTPWDDILRTYFGSDIGERCPLGLLKAAKRDDSIEKLQLVRMLMLDSSLDPENEIRKPIADFVREWPNASTNTSNLTARSIEGHNHISTVLGLSTAIPEEEAWGLDVVDFIAASSR